MENLLLIGYSPARVARPYQVLTLGLNTIVLAISLCLVAWIRHSYTGALYLLFPQLEIGSALAGRQRRHPPVYHCICHQYSGNQKKDTIDLDT